jgi:HK97 family phage portal protein
MLKRILGSFHRELPSPSEAIEAKEFSFPEIFLGAPTLSGPVVTPSTAMRVPAVANAVTLISTVVGTLPSKVFSRDPKGGKSADNAHPAHALVHDQANAWTSAGKLREILTADALLHGNGYAYANRVRGRVREFIRLDPLSVTVVASDTGEPVYRQGTGPNMRTFSYKDVLHIACPGVSHDGLTGTSPIHQAREAIGLALTLEQHAARLFGRGARPSGVLKFPSKLGPDSAARIRDSWHQAHAGEASGRTAVLEEGGDFQPLSFSSVDAQFAELRAFQIVEIARAFNVAPSMLQDMGRATWSNSEQANLAFLQLTLLPWLRAWEAAYRRTLLTPTERDQVSIEFVLDDLLRADTATRAQAYASFRAMGVMSANEIRSKENLPAHPDGDTLSNPFTDAGKPASSSSEGSVNAD